MVRYLRGSKVAPHFLQRRHRRITQAMPEEKVFRKPNILNTINKARVAAVAKNPPTDKDSTESIPQSSGPHDKVQRRCPWGNRIGTTASISDIRTILRLVLVSSACRLWRRCLPYSPIICCMSIIPSTVLTGSEWEKKTELYDRELARNGTMSQKLRQSPQTDPSTGDSSSCRDLLSFNWKSLVAFLVVNRIWNW